MQEREEIYQISMYIFKHNIAQNQSFAQKEVGQNIYSFKKASISLFIALPQTQPYILINVTLLLFK